MPGYAETSDADRRVHAQSGEEFLVRYNRAGHWYVEYVPARYRPRRRVDIRQAVDLAADMLREGGQVHLGLHGGKRFDALLRKHPLYSDGGPE